MRSVAPGPTPGPAAAAPGPEGGAPATATAELARDFLSRVTVALGTLDLGRIEATVDALVAAWRDERRVYVLGNGGSAATASHFANDLHAATRGPRRLGVFSLVDNLALLTALANDLGYERVFSEQLAAAVGPGDVVVAISASGDSPNVLAALELARERGAVTVSWLGFGGGRARTLSDIALVLESRDYGVVESVHATLEHLVASAVRRRLGA